MARKVKKQNTEPSGSVKPTFDQNAIDAALAGAVTMRDGSPVPSMRKEPTENLPDKNGAVASKETIKADNPPTAPIAVDQRKFGEDCYNFNIDAKKCHYQSTKHEDKSILEYVRAINKKIYDETCIGGFSTNVQFRVTPQDWVNVSHIKDWYIARGFEVVDKGTSSPAYGREVGTMNYNFTISWANAK